VMSRLFRSWFVRIIVPLRLLWLVFVVGLVGGLKILIVGWVVASLLYAGFRLFKSIVGKRA
jgi:hypothetical protein